MNTLQRVKIANAPLVKVPVGQAIPLRYTPVTQRKNSFPFWRFLAFCLSALIGTAVALVIATAIVVIALALGVLILGVAGASGIIIAGVIFIVRFFWNVFEIETLFSKE